MTMTTNMMTTTTISPLFQDEPEKDSSAGKRTSKTRFCRECQVVVLSQGIQKKVSEMKYITKIDPVSWKGKGKGKSTASPWVGN